MAQGFRVIILQSFVQRTAGFDLLITPSLESWCVSTGSGRKQICVTVSILNSNPYPTHLLKLCNWVKLSRHVSFLRMSCVLVPCLASPTNALLSGGGGLQWTKSDAQTCMNPRTRHGTGSAEESYLCLSFPASCQQENLAGFTFKYLVLLSSWAFLSMKVKIFGPKRRVLYLICSRW